MVNNKGPIMSLNLGLNVVNTTKTTTAQKKQEEPVVVLSDILSAELEFTEAYQAFVDYKNVCEIVVKAKASTECLSFAKDLIGCDVEHASLSVESLREKMSAAWEKFKVLWTQFVKWFKEFLKKGKALFYKFINYPVTVSPSTQGLKDVTGAIDSLLKFQDDPKTQEKVTVLINKIRTGLATTGKIESPEQATEWVSCATSVIKSFNSGISIVKEEYSNGKRSNYDKNKDLGTNSGKIKNPYVGLRWIMICGPIVVKRLRTTISKLAAQAQEATYKKSEETGKEEKKAEEAK